MEASPGQLDTRCGTSENKSTSDTYLAIIRIKSNVSETRAADETCQGLQLKVKGGRGRSGRYPSPWFQEGMCEKRFHFLTWVKPIPVPPSLSLFYMLPQEQLGLLHVWVSKECSL